MNQTIVSLASAATIGSAMLLWKLFTGEHTDTDDAVEHDGDHNQAASSGNSTDASQPVGEGSDRPMHDSLMKVELSGTWTDASSQCADDETVQAADSTSIQHASQHDEPPQEDYDAGTASSQRPQHAELQASESFASAASLRDSLCDDDLSPSSNSPAGNEQSAVQKQLQSGATPPKACVISEMQQAVEEQPVTAEASSQIDSNLKQDSVQDEDSDKQHLDLQQDSDAAGDKQVTHQRQSSHEQMEFAAVEPRVGFGALFGHWDDHNSRSTAGAAEESVSQDSPASEVEVEVPEQQPAEEGRRLVDDEQSLEEDAPCSQHHKLQPLNFDAADTVLDAQHAMTDELWASLRTVEVCQQQQADCSPSDPSAAEAALSEPPDPAVSDPLQTPSSSESVDICASAFALPLECLSAAVASSPRSNGSAAFHVDAGHSRQPSYAVSEGGGALGVAGDWPSIQLQGSLLPDATVDSSSSQQQATAAKGKGSSLLGDKTAPQQTEAKARALQRQQQPVPGIEQESVVLVPPDRQADYASQCAAAGVDDSSLPAQQGAAEPQQQQPIEAQQQSHTPQQLMHPEHKQASQHIEEEGVEPQQHERQQLAGILLPATSEQQQPSSCAQHHQPLNQQSVQAEQQQQGLLLPEFTVPTESLDSYSSSPSAVGSCKLGPCQLGNEQQALAGQLLKDDQQLRQPSSCEPHSPLLATAAASVVPVESSAGSRHSPRALLLQAVDVGGLPTAVPAAAASSSSQSGHSGLLLQPIHSSQPAVHELCKSDLAAGLAAHRSWRPSRPGFDSLVGGGPAHSKVPLMTTPASDRQPDLFRSSLQQQQQQLLLQQQQQTLHKSADLHTSLIPSSSMSISSSSQGNGDNNAAAACNQGAAGSHHPDDGDGVPWLRLVVSSGPAAGKSFKATNRTGELVIGRNPMSWASIPDQEISGKHACLSWSGSMNCWQVTDAGSLNGTSLNGSVISKPGRQPGHPAALKNGDILELGSITHAVVECGPAVQQAEQAAAAAPIAPAVARMLQQQQPEQQSSHSLQQTLKAPSAGRQQQKHQVLDSHSPQQQHSILIDSRYNTWTSGHPSPGSSSSSGGNHRRSLGSPPTATATLRPRAAASCLGFNSSNSGSGSRGNSHSQLQTQVHYRTGACLSQSGSSSCYQDSPSSPAGALLAPLVKLQFPQCRVQGAVAKVVGADHRRSHMACEDVVAWRTPLADWPTVGLFCVFDGHHSRCASEQAQELLPRLLVQHLSPLQEQQQEKQQQHNSAQQPAQQQSTSSHGSNDSKQPQQQIQPAPALLSNDPGIAAALRSSFLETDQQLSCDDGCTATAVLLEGCPGGSVMLRVANVGDSMALLVDVSNAGWRSLTEDHRIAGNPTEAARLTAKNHNVPGGVSTRLYGLNIARMLGDRFLKEQDVGFTAEPYISEGIVLGPDDEAVLLVASDGLWDVVSQERAAAMAGKTVADRAKAAKSSSAGTAAAHAGAEQAQESSTDGAAVSADVLDLTGGQGDGSTVAAAVAEALMHAALSLRSKDDISVMVLHVLPAGKAEHGAAVGTTGSGSI